MSDRGKISIDKNETKKNVKGHLIPDMIESLVLEKASHPGYYKTGKNIWNTVFIHWKTGDPQCTKPIYWTLQVILRDIIENIIKWRCTLYLWNEKLKIV